MAKRAPFVAVRTDIRKEERVLVIADIGGYNRHEAIGRLVDMWAWCADRKLEDAPDGSDSYAVPEPVIRRFLGPRGVEAILGDGCDELALGERRLDGLIALRGTSETVLALRGNVRTASAGGRARVDVDPPRSAGRFVSGDTSGDVANSAQTLDRQQSTSCAPASDQPATSQRPAATSVDPRSKNLDPYPDKIPLPRKRSSGPRDPKPAVPGHQETIACFTERFESAYGTKPTWDGRRGKQVQELLRAHGEAEVRRRIGILFSGGLAWPAGPYDFDTLVKHFDKLAQPARAGPANGHHGGPTVLQALLSDIELLEQKELDNARQHD